MQQILKSTKHLFTRAPFTGWLIIAAIFIGLAALLSSKATHRHHPRQLSQLIQEDFRTRERAVTADRPNFFTNFPHAPVNPRVPGFYLLHIYRGDHIAYWNNNLSSIPLTEKQNNRDTTLADKLITANNGVYYLKKYRHDSSMAYVFIPIATNYPVENRYFKNHFYAGNSIPQGTLITETSQTPESIAIIDARGKPVFFVTFQGDPLASYVPSLQICLLFFAGVFFFCFWLNKCCVQIGRRKHPFYGWLLLVIILQAIFNLFSCLPFYIRNTELFGPFLLSSGDNAQSLGDLLIYCLADTWMLAYLFLKVGISNIAIFGERHQRMNRVIALLSAMFAVFLIFESQMMRMHLLIIDSKIPFEVTDFSYVNIYTFSGLFAFAIITLNIILLLSIFSELNKSISSKPYVKYILFLATCLLIIFISHGFSFMPYEWSTTGFSLAGLYLISRLGMPVKPAQQSKGFSYSSSIYIWFALVCMAISLEVFFFNYGKEHELRKVVAQKLERKPDIVTEFAFSEQEDKIATDSLLIRYFLNGNYSDRITLRRHLVDKYLSSSFKKYRISLYFYNKHRQPLHARDSADLVLVRIVDSLRGAEKGLASGLTYLPSLPDDYIYRADIPVRDGEDTIGYVAVNLNIGETAKRETDPLFLSSTYNPADQQYFDKYSYAHYIKGKLHSESGINTFPYTISLPAPSRLFEFKESLTESILYYRLSEEEVVCVVYKRRLLLNVVSLFSYVLGTLVLVSLCFFLVYHLLISPERNKRLLSRLNLTIRAKVNLTILITVFLSFIILGIITVSFLISRYRNNQEKSLQNATSSVSNSVMKSIDKLAASMTPEAFVSFVQAPEFASELNEIAMERGVDINIYSTTGGLKATSQQNFDQKGYLSRIMNRKAFLVLVNEQRKRYTQTEQTGTLKYPSSYMPIKNNQGRVLGYINIPYYTSGAELQDEISNILALLINLYTFIFFLSGLSAVLISNNVIRSFNVFINQFKSVRLRHNEPLHWPYKDEIGMLVNEYNAMIQKVEGMATRLANSEREAAWREIAKQVAHEIKNPLTPMKLQVQYLQQAIDKEESQLSTLTNKVTKVLLEQIEQLTIIASEFSNFAKLPEANPERLDAREVIEMVVQLFQKGRSTLVTIDPCNEVFVWMDKSYFIRIMTNIIQNAIQAIPQGREGRVEVTCTPEEKCALISIRDNGCGIEPEQLAKLFLPYFTTKSSGTGLGLPMTKNMIELSNGSISVETEVGVGTVFKIRIPLSEW